MAAPTGHKISHSLRITIFMLRLGIGLNFFYLGWSALFNQALGHQLSERSLGDLYAWVGSAVPSSSHTLFAWAFLVIGICIMIGLFTRLMGIAGIALTLASYLPTFNYNALTASQLINDEVIVILCLLVLIAANAGRYIGLDVFVKRKKLDNRN